MNLAVAPRVGYLKGMEDTTLIQEITELTMLLKNEHPEVYAHLDENPTTLKFTQGHGASSEELKEYLQTLKDLMAKHS